MQPATLNSPRILPRLWMQRFSRSPNGPLMWPVTRTDPGVRARHLLAFHYTIFYRVTADLIRIVAVTHMRRSPDSWNRR